MELTISAGDLPPTTIPLFATASTDGQTVYMPATLATPSTLGKHAQPAHVQAAIDRSIEEARKPRSYALFFTSAWTDWRPFLWQCVDTEKEAEEGSLLLNTFLRSTGAMFAKTWAVSTAEEDARNPFAVIEGNTPGGIILSPQSEPGAVHTIDSNYRKSARLDIDMPPPLVDIGKEAQEMARRTHIKLWGAAGRSGVAPETDVDDAMATAGVGVLDSVSECVEANFCAGVDAL